MVSSTKRNKGSKTDVTVSVGIPWAVMGFTLGIIGTTAFYYFGSRFVDTDAAFLRTFPEWEKAYPDVQFEFPARLEHTDAESVGATPKSPDQDLADQTTDQKTNEPVSVVVPTPAIDDNLAEVATTEGEVTGYVLQVGVFRGENRADALRASLLRDGYDAYTTTITADDSSIQYRVIIGPYDSAEDTTADADRLKDRNILPYLVPITKDE